MTVTTAWHVAPCDATVHAANSSHRCDMGIWGYSLGRSLNVFNCRSVATLLPHAAVTRGVIVAPGTDLLSLLFE